MKFIKLLIIIPLIGSLSLIGCAPIASSESSATAAGSSIDSKSDAEKPWIVKTGKNPSSVVFSPNGQLAAVINYSDQNISVYTVDAYTGAFKLVPGSPFATGHLPMSVTFFPTGKFAVVPNFGDGTISVYRVDAKNGVFTPVLGSPFATEGWPKSVAFSPTGRFAAITDLLNNTVNFYTMDEQTGKFTRVQERPFATGYAPESVAFSPNGQLAAVTNTQDNTISVYNSEANSGRFIPVHGSPFKTGAEPNSVAFSPNGQLAAVTNYLDNTLSVYKVDAKNEAFTPVKDSPFATGSYPLSIAFSPDGKFVAVINTKDNKISVYSVDANTGEFVPVHHSPFKTGLKPWAIAFSPTTAIVAVTNSDDNTLWIYEIDQDTGKFRPITGGLLGGKEQFKKAKESFAEFGQQKHATEKGEQAGLGAQTPVPVDLIIGEYLVGLHEEPNVSSAKENREEETLHKALEQTKKDRLQAERNKPLLFTAIKAGDLKSVQENLTPFTINSLNEQRRTPLMEALYYGTPQNNQNKDLINLLLAYKGIAQETSLHKEIITVNTAMRDAEGDTALMLAIRQKKFELALIITQHMKPSEFAIKNKEGKTALDLLKEQPSYNDTWLYESLFAILQSNMSK